MQSNFILTNVIKIGDHVSYEKFINRHSLADQTFDLEGEYFRLHNYDLDSYDRKFAIIEFNLNTFNYESNKEYTNELDRRIKLLHSQGFKFIMASPWESKDNLSRLAYYQNKKLDSAFEWTGGVEWFWFLLFEIHQNKRYKFDHHHKTHDFLYLNKNPRPHRDELYKQLQSTNILQNSLVSNLNLHPPVRLPEEYESPKTKSYPLGPSGHLDNTIYEAPYSATKFSLVSETNDNSHEVFLTEKIWKPIIAEQLFVVHGNHLTLQTLRDLGFKTFNNYFDESYDLEADRHEKIKKIIQLCETLQHSDWKDLYLQTKAIRKHNRENFFNEESLSKSINQTLICFLEFFDRS